MSCMTSSSQCGDRGKSSSACVHSRRYDQVATSCCARDPTKNNPKGTTPHTLKMTTKTLTDFSIDSIIGQQQQQQQQQQQLQHEQPGDHYGDSQQSKTNDDAQVSSHQNIYQQKKFRPKNFQCPVCRMAFSNNGQLKNHVRIHTGERPFWCNQAGCNKSFTRNEELTRHKLIHTGVRPHACPSCFKRFGRKDHLKKHVRTHERKRLRKRVYVSTSTRASTKQTIVNNDDANKVGGQLGDDSIYSPEKVKTQRNQPTTCAIPSNFAAAAAAAAAAVTTTAAAQALPVLPIPMGNFPTITFDHLSSFAAPTLAPVTLQQHFNFSSYPTGTITSSGNPNNLSATTGETLQDLAGDYWKKWYSFLGFCQHQTIESNKRI